MEDELTAADEALLGECADVLERLDAPPPAAYTQVLVAFGHERERQLARYGHQLYPDGTGQPGDAAARFEAQHRCRQAAAADVLTWRHVLDEEIAEAYAETDPDRLEAELVQAGAVIAAWIEDLRDQRRHQA